MKKLLTLLFAAALAFSLSAASFAQDTATPDKKADTKKEEKAEKKAAKKKAKKEKKEEKKEQKKDDMKYSRCRGSRAAGFRPRRFAWIIRPQGQVLQQPLLSNRPMHPIGKGVTSGC